MNSSDPISPEKAFKIAGQIITVAMGAAADSAAKQANSEGS